MTKRSEVRGENDDSKASGIFGSITTGKTKTGRKPEQAELPASKEARIAGTCVKDSVQRAQEYFENIMVSKPDEGKLT